MNDEKVGVATVRSDFSGNAGRDRAVTFCTPTTVLWSPQMRTPARQTGV